MALTLVEAAKLSNDDLQRGVIEVFIQESNILDRIPMLEINGNAYAYNSEAALPGVEFRAVNSRYAESTGIVNQASERLVILGGDADVDTFIQQTRSNLNDQRAIQTRMKVKAANYKFQDTFFNGDVEDDANAFDGLKKRITGDQVVTADTNGLPVLGTTDEDKHKFLDKLDEAIAKVGQVDAIYLNASILAKLKSSARRLHFYDQTTDDFGKTVSMYNGIPLIDPGFRLDSAGKPTVPILPQTEKVGSSSVTSSIYFVKFGQDESDGGVTGLTNGGIQVRDLGEVDDKPAYRTRIEFFCGVGVFGGRAAARLRGVLNA